MTIYYVDNSSVSASNNNVGTSADSPLLSLAGVALLKLQPGDTVAFKAGTSYEGSAAGSALLTIKTSGTEGAPISFTSYGQGEAPVITNTSTAMYSDAFSVKGASYVVFDGLHVTGASQAAFNIDQYSSHVTIKNVEANSVGEAVLLKGHDSVVTQNYFHDLVMVKNTVGAKGTTAGDDDYGANGVVVSGNGNEISFNLIVNAKAPSYDYGVDGGAIEVFGGVQDLSVHDNIVKDSAGFFELGGLSSLATSGGGNISITNNISINNGVFSVIHNAGGAFGIAVSDIDVSGNTIIETGLNEWKSSIIYLDKAASKEEVDIHDNVIVVGDRDSIFKQNGGNYHSDNVIQILTPTTHVYNNWKMDLASGEVLTTVSFADAANGDYTLAGALAGTGKGAELDLAEVGIVTLVAEPPVTPPVVEPPAPTVPVEPAPVTPVPTPVDVAPVTPTPSESFSYTSTIQGTSGNDKISALTGNNKIDAGDGNNTVTTGAGHDKIITGSGADNVTSGDGNNIICTGAGNDNITDGNGNSTIWSAAGNDIVRAGDGNKTIYAGGGNDYVSVGKGSNAIFGEGGDDKLYGGAGNDTLDGGAGKNVLSGGAGNDVLISSGTDYLTGGTGSDTFVFKSVNAGVTNVTDFSLAQGDQLDLSNLLQVYNPGHDSINDFVIFTTSGKNTFLSVDLDGAGTAYSAQKIAYITGVSNLDAGALLKSGALVISGDV